MVKPAAIKNSGSELDDGRLPAHVAVIMDGNGRWARKRNLPRVAGHRKGAESARNLITLCGHRKISFLTLFAFSSENWKRPQSEVSRLMDIFVSALDKDVKKLHESNVRFRVIGERSSLSSGIVKKIEKGETLTAANTGLQLNVAINYGGKWDVLAACQSAADLVASGERKPGSITIKDLEKGLSTAGQPDPDLFIRTGGEHRISNFLLWQLAYTELYFSDTLWPDFGEQEFERALGAYASRQRRFGQTGEQVGAG